MRWSRIYFGLVAALPLVLSCSDTSRGRPLSTSTKLTIKKYTVPYGFKVIAESEIDCYPSLLPLGEKTIPQLVKATAGAVMGIPPCYYNLQNGQLIGAVAVGGRIYKTCPLNLKVRPYRTVVIVRRKPIRDGWNLAYIRPSRLPKLLKGHCLSSRAIKRLGINIKQFDVVTMDVNATIQPFVPHERSWFAAGPQGLGIFSTTERLTFRQMITRSRGAVGNKPILFPADGGATIRYPELRRSKVCLLLVKWPYSHSLAANR